MKRNATALTLSAVLALSAAPALATDFRQDALKMILKQNTSSGKEKLVWVSKVPAIGLPAADPIAVGGSLRVQGVNQDVSVPFPAGAANWKTNGAGTLFKFVNKDAPSGPSPCKVAVIKEGAVFKIVCKDSIIELNDPTQGTVALTFTVAGDRYCSTCSGPLGTFIKSDEPGKFICKGQPAPASCGLGPTTTTTTTSTTTTSTLPPAPVCGNGTQEAGESCDDGNLSNNDPCPADCMIDPCTPNLGTDLAVTVNFDAPPAQGVAGMTVLLDYPEGKVSLPGSGAVFDPTIMAIPSGASALGNDFDHATRVNVARATNMPEPGLFVAHFETCQGQSPPTAGQFTCTVLDAANQLGVDVLGVTCSVVVP